MIRHGFLQLLDGEWVSLDKISMIYVAGFSGRDNKEMYYVCARMNKTLLRVWGPYEDKSLADLELSEMMFK